VTKGKAEDGSLPGSCRKAQGWQSLGAPGSGSHSVVWLGLSKQLLGVVPSLFFIPAF